MTAATVKHWRPSDRTSDAGDLTPIAIGGFLLGLLTVALCIVIDLVVLMTALNVSGVSETGNPWPAWGLAAIAVVAAIVSVFMGRWLVGMRRWIGTKGDPSDHDTITRKRRAFLGGAMFAYVPLTPCVWLLMVAFANSP